MNNHTPGPWVLLAEPHATIVIASAEPRIDDRAFGVAIIPHHEEQNRISWEIKESNARLIAAAPDMLEALQSVAAWNEHEDACDECLSGPCSVGRPLRQKASHLTAMAIAKATGKETL